MSQVKRVASDEISQISLKISKVDNDGGNPKELARIEKQKQKEAERAERERRKEEERIERERKKEEERQEKEKRKEEERIEKEKRREEERIAKELKKQKLLEEKHERERKREEEKEKKQAERERQKLEKKRKMDEEKERKEHERKLAEEIKERSQMKISSFFQVGKAKEEKTKEVAATQDSSSYDREFLPFFVQNNVVMADNGQMSSEELAKSKQDFDALMKSGIPAAIPVTSQDARSVGQKVTPEDIISALNAANTTEAQVYSMLQQIPPIKYISFYENSKPPYVGTWCSERHRIQLPISNPIDTSLTGLDYDYDSDLEWNKEDEEGEDLDDDEEEEDEVLEDDDIEDFVENNQDAGPARKFHSLVVVSKWNDGTNDDFFSSLSTTVCVDIPTPIDPTKTYTKEVPEVSTPTKKTIQDPVILKGLVEFIEKNQDFTIGTLVELSKKEFKEFTKAMLKNTIQAMAVYNKKTSNWQIKPEVKSNCKIPT